MCVATYNRTLRQGDGEKMLWIVAKKLLKIRLVMFEINSAGSAGPESPEVLVYKFISIQLQMIKTFALIFQYRHKRRKHIFHASIENINKK